MLDLKDKLKLKKKKSPELGPVYDECTQRVTMLTEDEGFKETSMEFMEQVESDLEFFGKQRKEEVVITIVSACSWKPFPFCVS